MKIMSLASDDIHIFFNTHVNLFTQGLLELYVKVENCCMNMYSIDSFFPQNYRKKDPAFSFDSLHSVK